MRETKTKYNHRLYVYESVLRMLQEGELYPGQAISEEMLSNLLDVSRTPVREALLMLQAEGFVAVFPKKGSFVSKYSFQEILDIYNVRIVMEPALISARCGAISPADRTRLAEFRAYNEKHTGDNERLELGSDFLRMDYEFHRFLLTLSRNTFFEKTANTALLKCSIARGSTPYFVSCGEIAVSHLEIIDAICAMDSAKTYDAIESHIRAIRDRYLKYYTG